MPPWVLYVYIATMVAAMGLHTAGLWRVNRHLRNLILMVIDLRISVNMAHDRLTQDELRSIEHYVTQADGFLGRIQAGRRRVTYVPMVPPRPVGPEDRPDWSA